MLGIKISPTMANCCLTDASSAKSAITILVSSRTLPVIQTDLLATLFNGLLHGREVISVNGPGKAQQSLARHSTNSGCYERTGKFQHPTLLFNRQLTELFANFGLHSLRYHNLFMIVCYFYCCLIIVGCSALREWTSARVATLVLLAKPYTPTFNHDELEPVKKSKAYRLKFDQCALEEVKPNHRLLDSDMI